MSAHEETSDAPASGGRTAATRFELKISLSFGLEVVDLLVDASAADTVADLAHAVSAWAGADRGLSLWCERRSRALVGATPLDRAGIRWGDSLLLAPSPQEATVVGGIPKVELLVTGGPCSGQSWTLGEGVYRIGRDTASDVRLVDPSLSREHALVEVRDTTVSITDLGSSNGVAIDGKAIAPQVPQLLLARNEVEFGRTLIKIQPLNADAGHDLVEQRGRIELNRPPRVNPPFEPFSRQLPAPPSRAHKARLPLAASVVPLVMGLAMFILLNSYFMLVICALSPLMAVTTYLTERRGGKKSFSRGSAEFRRSVESAARDLDRALEAEASVRRAESPDPSALFERVRKLEPTVWERRPGDRDFMCLRVGVADLPAWSSVSIADGGEEDLRDWADQLLAPHETIPSIPLTIDFRQAGVLGLAGPRSVTDGVARALVLQAASLHSPGDLAIAAALGEGATEEWSWLKWLPHLGVERIGLQSAFARGRRESEELLVDVRDLLADRRAQTKSRDGQPPRRTSLLLLLDEDAGVDRSLVSASLSAAAECGVTAIWLGHSARNLPGQSGAIVEALDNRSVVTVTDVASGRPVQDVTVDGVEASTADQLARSLAPIQDIGELARAGDIPPSVSLLELLNLSPVTASALEHRWKDWRGRLDATIGVGADGPFTIDLRADGPHALIAGTTGSGKSELLRTFVCAAAASAPPDRLAFLLIDYKGGSAFAPCAALPHVVDVVSDLDEHLAERALDSLRAELKRREQIFASLGAKDLSELRRRSPDEAPPLLVIAVDEFAKLRDEVPEFVDGVVDIAQRGRSLGVHMVLAAQTLRNAFTPAIRANTNLRLSLRVAEDAESEDVIASPLAARIPSGERYRGRAFARTGHSELREFQTAYVSGRTAAPERRELTLLPFSHSGSGLAGPTDGSFDSDHDNDITALAVAAGEAQSHLGLRSPTPPWQPSLPPVLDLDLLPTTPRRPGCAVIGLVDLPHLQRQDPLLIDLPAVGNVAVFGAGGSGKTTVLTTTALALAGAHPPEELRMYGLDAGSGDLGRIEQLPHCGGVVRIDDDERVDRLFRELVRLIETRPPVDSQNPAVRPTRRTVVFLDDLSTFVDRHDKPGMGTPYELLQKALAGGRTAGVHVVLTASRRAALPGVLSAHVGQRLILRMPTDEELLALGLDAKRVRGAKLPAGRGFTQDSQEFQVAVPTADGETQDFDQAAREIQPGSRDATRLVTLATSVPRTSLEPASSVDRIPVGVADSDLGTATVNLSDGHFLVVGPYRSGRSTALETLAIGVSQVEPAPLLWLFAPRRSPLRDLDIWEERATTSEACGAAIDALVQRIGAQSDESQDLFLFVDDAGEIGEPLLSQKLERVVRAGRDGGLTVVAAAETSAARGIAISWVREVRKDGHGLLLQPDLLADGDLLGTRLPRRVAAPMVPGRGFVVSRGTSELVQVAS